MELLIKFDVVVGVIVGFVGCCYCWWCFCCWWWCCFVITVVDGVVVEADYC